MIQHNFLVTCARKLTDSRLSFGQCQMEIFSWAHACRSCCQTVLNHWRHILDAIVINLNIMWKRTEFCEVFLSDYFPLIADGISGKCY